MTFLELARCNLTFKESHTTQFHGLKTMIQGTQHIIQETANETDQHKEDYRQVRQVITFEHASE